MRKIRVSVRRRSNECLSYYNLQIGRCQCVTDKALEERAHCVPVGPAELQLQRCPPPHGRVEHPRPVGDEKGDHRRAFALQCIDLLDENIDPRTILVVRLHLIPRSSEVVGLIEDQDTDRSIANVSLRLVEDCGQSCRDFTNTTEPTYVPGSLKDHNVTIEPVGKRGRDGQRQLGLTTADVAREQDQWSTPCGSIREPKAAWVMLAAPCIQTTAVEQQLQCVEQICLLSIDADKSIKPRLSYGIGMSHLCEFDCVHSCHQFPNL